MLDLNAQTQLPNISTLLSRGLSGGLDPLATIESSVASTLGNASGGIFGDGIARLLPPGFSDGGNNAVPGAPNPAGTPPSVGGPLSGITNLLMQLVGMLGSLLGMGGNPGFGNPGVGNPGGGFGGAENYFSNATGSSTGDPHLAFSGNGSGGNIAGTWNSMTGQSDLLDSDSIPGGFSISTTPTQPNAQGITYNASASVATNGGATSITFNSDGTASLTQNGVTNAIARGQNLSLPGESINWNPDGSLLITVDGGNGSAIATTMSSNGNGVDVRATAQNVDLGGALVSGATLQPNPPVIAPPPIIANPESAFQRL